MSRPITGYTSSEVGRPKCCSTALARQASGSRCKLRVLLRCLIMHTRVPSSFACAGHTRHLLCQQRGCVARRAAARHRSPPHGRGGGNGSRVGVPLRRIGEAPCTAWARGDEVEYCRRLALHSCNVGAFWCIAGATITQTHARPAQGPPQRQRAHIHMQTHMHARSGHCPHSTATLPTRRRGGCTRSWATSALHWSHRGRPTSTVAHPTAARSC